MIEGFAGLSFFFQNGEEIDDVKFVVFTEAHELPVGQTWIVGVQGFVVIGEQGFPECCVHLILTWGDISMRARGPAHRSHHGLGIGAAAAESPP